MRDADPGPDNRFDAMTTIALARKAGSWKAAETDMHSVAVRLA